MLILALGWVFCYVESIKQMVAESNLVEIKPRRSRTCDQGTDPVSSADKNDMRASALGNDITVADDVEAADGETHALQIPATIQQTGDFSTTVTSEEAQTTSSMRLVSGSCAICLCPYVAGDEVTWSPRATCQHAFHSECIIPWLAKADAPTCPCCRQGYCDPIPIAQLELDPVSLFGATGFLGENHFAGDGNGDGFGMPHFVRSLETSRLEFLTTLEIAAIEAVARHRELNADNDSLMNASQVGGGSDEEAVAETAAAATPPTTITSGLFGGTPFEMIDSSTGDGNGAGDEEQQARPDEGANQTSATRGSSNQLGSPFEVVISNDYVR